MKRKKKNIEKSKERLKTRMGPAEVRWLSVCMAKPHVWAVIGFGEILLRVHVKVATKRAPACDKWAGPAWALSNVLFPRVLGIF